MGHKQSRAMFWLFFFIVSAVSVARASGDPVASVKALKEKLARQGAISIEGSYKLSGKDVPGLKFGNFLVNANEHVIVDAIKNERGGICTIFIRVGDDFIRASTNALAKDGTRCMGTLLTRPGSVYKAIIENKSFSGEANICGDVYNTYYEPITIGKKVVGIYLCGYEKEN